MSIFDGIITAAPTNQSTTQSISIEQLLALKKEIDAMGPPTPTPEQRLWALANGFPGWPGFKLGRVAYARLRWGYQAKAPPFMPEPPHGVLYGVPVVMDEKLADFAVVSAERLWKMEKQALNAENS